jgi:hypothetical protein
MKLSSLKSNCKNGELGEYSVWALACRYRDQVSKSRSEYWRTLASFSFNFARIGEYEDGIEVSMVD